MPVISTLEQDQKLYNSVLKFQFAFYKKLTK